MFVIHSYSTAVLFCIVTMICWGSWANTQKLSSKSWAFQLFYWDAAKIAIKAGTMQFYRIGIQPIQKNYL